MNTILKAGLGAATSLLLVTSMNSTADNHEAEDYGMSLLSTYEYAPGVAPADLEKGMVEYQKAQEKAGFDDCGVYRHEFGDTRGIYTYCAFKDMHQFAKIMDAEPSSADMEPQPFAGHTDHIVTVVERNMDEAPPYVVFSYYKYAAGLSANQAEHYGKQMSRIYNEAFGACNTYAHTWGPELGMYLSCGFDNYGELADANDKLGELLEEIMGDEPVFVDEHSDDILMRVMD